MLVCRGVKPCLKLPPRDMLHANDRASGLWILTSWAQPNLHGASSSHPGDIAAANRIDVRHIGNISMFHVYVKCMTYIKIIENGCVTSNIHYIMTNMCLACSIGPLKSRFLAVIVNVARRGPHKTTCGWRTYASSSFGTGQLSAFCVIPCEASPFWSWQMLAKKNIASSWSFRYHI